MGDGYDHTLLGCPDGEVGEAAPLHLVPVVVILLQTVGATLLQMKVEGLLLHCFLNSMVPPPGWALHLNDVCISHQIIGGGTQDPTVSQSQTRPSDLYACDFFKRLYLFLLIIYTPLYSLYSMQVLIPTELGNEGRCDTLFAISTFPELLACQLTFPQSGQR